MGSAAASILVCRTRCSQAKHRHRHQAQRMFLCDRPTCSLSRNTLLIMRMSIVGGVTDAPGKSPAAYGPAGQSYATHARLATTVGHATGPAGHDPEIAGHDAGTVDHDGPRYALRLLLDDRNVARTVRSRCTLEHQHPLKGWYAAGVSDS